MSESRQQKSPLNDSELARLRALTVEQGLEILGLFFSVDDSYRSYKNGKSKRLQVMVGNRVVEIIATGAKWFDTRTKRGGGGAIDLTMHLYEEPFHKAVTRLRMEIRHTVSL